MEVKTFKCPNCGAGLKFDPLKQGFTCESCDSTFSEQELIRLSEEAEKKAESAAINESEKAADTSKSSDKNAGAKVYSYICGSCGAEVTATETTASTFCYYCGNPVVLTDRVVGDEEPDSIIPFKINKTQATDSFMRWVKSKKFVPNNFFEKSGCIMSGMYYPYWKAGVTFDASFNGKGKIVNTVGGVNEDIITTRHYSIERAGTVELNNIIRPALKNTDRQLSDGVQPYDYSESHEFEMGYMAGFFAERKNIESKEVDSDIVTEADSYVEELLTEDTNYTDLKGDANTVVKKQSYGYMLLPTWVITYKGRDGETYHYSLNGQTGRACGKLPIDKARLNRFCFLIGGAVSAVMLLGGWLLW